MWGIFDRSPVRRRILPGTTPTPSLTGPSSLASNSSCMPTQMPSRGRPPSSHPATAAAPPAEPRPLRQAPYAPTPGTTSPAAPPASATVGTTRTSAPARSSALAAEWRFPTP